MHFLSLFLAYLETTYISCYAFPLRGKFSVFKLDKTKSKNLNEEGKGESKNQEVGDFERVTLSLLRTFAGFFSIGECCTVYRDFVGD